MADLILVAVLVVFIALCVAYVGWCDRIIGTDAVASTAPDAATTPNTPSSEAVSA